MTVKKISDFDDGQRKQLSTLLDTKSDNFGICYYEGTGTGGINKGSEFGLCSDCVFFQCIKSEFRTRIAKCQSTDIFLSSADPVTECTEYGRRGSMSLSDMKEIAMYIDASEDTIGFK